jgi:hypothetical protein
MKFAFLIAAAAIGLGACTTASSGGTQSASSDPRDCFQSALVNNFDPVDDTHVRISINARRTYLVTTASSMRTNDWTHPLVLDAPNQVCVGDVTGVRLVGGEPRRAFVVTHIERVPDAQPEGS